jgi:RNA polymerase sigma-70 factor (ECF subfamily)
MTTAVWEGTRVSADFAEFYRSTFGDLAGYGWSLTRDPHVGDELAQEALTRVYARWPFSRDARPYAYRIVTNLARDRWRAQQRERNALPDLVAQESVTAPDDTTLDAVRRLAAPLREVVLLHYYADLPVEEVARVVRRPAGTVKRRLFDARAALAVALEETR